METVVAELKFMKLSPAARIPTRGTRWSAGWDLYALEDVAISASAQVPTPVHTGIAVQFPPGTYGKILSRSGLSFNAGIETCAGVIDADYSGEIIVGLVGKKDYQIVAGQRCAQLIVHYYYCGDAVEVDSFKTNYPAHLGFGSTGL